MAQRYSKTDDQRGYDNWKRNVDLLVEQKLGIDTESLPDAPYWDWFQDGMTSKQAAARAIRHARNF